MWQEKESIWDSANGWKKEMIKKLQNKKDPVEIAVLNLAHSFKAVFLGKNGMKSLEKAF